MLDFIIGLDGISKSKNSLKMGTFSLALAQSFPPWIKLFIGCFPHDLRNGLVEAYVAFTRTELEAEMQLC